MERFCREKKAQSDTIAEVQQKVRKIRSTKIGNLVQHFESRVDTRIPRINRYTLSDFVSNSEHQNGKRKRNREEEIFWVGKLDYEIR